VGVEMHLGTVVAALVRLGLPLAVVVVVGVGGNTGVARYGRRGILIVVRTGLTVRRVWRAVVLLILMVVISHRGGSNKRVFSPTIWDLLRR